MTSTGHRAVHPSHSAFLAAIGLALVACGQGSSPVEPRQSENAGRALTVLLAVGQSAAFGHSGVLTFERVTGDSRCPTGATCPSAGEVTLAMSLESGSAKHPFTLSDRANAVAFERFLVELVSIEPYPEASAPIGESDYRALIRVTQRLF